MTYSLYDATVVMAKSALTSLARILTEAEKHPNSASFFAARLVDDMKPLTFQVHYAAFQAQVLAAKLSGYDYTEPVEDLDTYEKMHVRIQQAIDALDHTSKETVDTLGETETTISIRDAVKEVPVKAIVGLVNMPNVYFHVSMAYAILRKEGVPLGKRHWSRGFVSDYI